jgi:hypothetical protein
MDGAIKKEKLLKICNKKQKILHLEIIYQLRMSMKFKMAKIMLNTNKIDLKIKKITL